MNLRSIGVLPGFPLLWLPLLWLCGLPSSVQAGGGDDDWRDWDPALAGRPMDGAAYMAGKLGIVEPIYSERMLWVAYRHLSGLPVPPDPALLDPMGYRSDHLDNPRRDWLQARRDFSPLPFDKRYIWTERSSTTDQDGVDVYSHFENCLDGGFRYAVSTWQARAERYGAESREVVEWVRGQDAVFANCSEGEQIPPPLDGSWPAELRRDRDYQIAAAYFYADRPGEAEARFRQIAADGESVHGPLAGYLVARAMARDHREQGALDYLDELLEAAPEHPYLPAARRLRAHLLHRLDPRAALARVSRDLVAADLLQEGVPSDGVASLDQDLEDFALGLYAERHLPVPPPLFADGEPAPLSVADDMKTWVQAMRRIEDIHNDDPRVLGERILRQAEITGAVHWWLAATAAWDPVWSDAPIGPRATLNDGVRARLSAAAPEVPEGPGAFAVRFRRLQLEAQAGDGEAPSSRASSRSAAPLQDESPSGDSLSADSLSVDSLSAGFEALLSDAGTHAERNRIQQVYARTAPDLGTYVERSLHFRPWSDADADPKERGLFRDAVRVLNYAEPETLFRLSKLPQLPARWAAHLAVTAWVRAFVLDRLDLMAREAPWVGSQVPPLKRDFVAWPDLPEDEKAFGAALLILRAPGFKAHLEEEPEPPSSWVGTDYYGQGWWCRESFALSAEPSYRDGPKQPTISRAAPDANAFLGGIVFDFAARKPDDPRLPEALHYVVRTTRTGCRNGEVSKKAFDLLHRRYKTSPWTAKTPYWYDKRY